MAPRARARRTAYSRTPATRDPRPQPPQTIRRVRPPCPQTIHRVRRPCHQTIRRLRPPRPETIHRVRWPCPQTIRGVRPPCLQPAHRMSDQVAGTPTSRRARKQPDSRSGANAPRMALAPARRPSPRSDLAGSARSILGQPSPRRGVRCTRCSGTASTAARPEPGALCRSAPCCAGGARCRGAPCCAGGARCWGSLCWWVGSGVQGGAVDEFLGVAVEGVALEQFQVEFGGVLEDPAQPALARDHREDCDLDSVDQTGGQ